ncbi:polysaccharide pyruvyl transferase family protein [Dyadobacter sp. LJ53]|uniref:polysaccharide pyruvyl transferase family protein n=1 Tax=Dyadobacter chenwenxiniae TaxID=2906456 RepID=UPI001F1ED57A|nr:polysaccharide pyruvyl transferase family protein [Dyadobacter chenwenxiniae]MCF0052403.1 polysaccharide pyruvyl transferase family protein [Dyadobacter chenwenxiniae]
MENHLFAGFNYFQSDNLGDYIQSLAAEQFIPAVHKRFNRDNLGEVKSPKKYILIMNGWFTHSPVSCFPLSPVFHPVFWGLHVTNWNNSWQHLISDPRSLDYLKAHQPVGCRDRFTQQKLESEGIESFYTKCLTLTFPKRDKVLTKELNVIVDVPIKMPPHIEANSVRLTHHVPKNISEHQKRVKAKKMIDFYKNNASTVITTRLHCALPCIAMGIPVIFLGDQTDYRISILEDVGVHINHFPIDYYSFSRERLEESRETVWNETNWNPIVTDFEDPKAELIQNFKEFLMGKLSL